MATVLDHERLQVYQVELKFITWASHFMRDLKQVTDISTREACDHLDRAMFSALLNTAEGNAKRQMRTRGRYFDDARGSAAECGACLDGIVAKGAATLERIEEGKRLLVRIVEMLTKLVQMYGAVDIHEDAQAYSGGTVEQPNG